MVNIITMCKYVNRNMYREIRTDMYGIALQAHAGLARKVISLEGDLSVCL